METKEPKPIRTDLFRFVTFRTPQLISDEKKAFSFIYHSDPEQSAILQGLNTDDIDKARDHVRQRAKNYNAFTKADEVKELAPDLYRFSEWLARYRNTLDMAGLQTFFPALKTLPKAAAIKIWDNLFYQFLSRKNSIIRQTCIQLLIADHVLSHVKKGDFVKTAEALIDTPRTPSPPPKEKRPLMLLRRIAKAKVVIPKAFSVEKSATDKEEEKKYEAVPRSEDYFMGIDHLNALTNDKVAQYEKMKEEIRLGMTAGSGVKKDLQAMAKSPDKDKFLSADTQRFLTNTPNEGVTLKLARDLIDIKVKAENKKTVRSIAYAKEKARQLRVQEKPSEREKRPGCFVITIDTIEQRALVHMTLYLGYVGGYVKSAQYQIAFDGKSPVKSEGVSILDSKYDEALLMRFFNQKQLTAGDAKTFRFEGKLQLADGKEATFNVEGTVGAPYTFGCIEEVQNTDEEPDDIEVPTRTAGELFGVNRLGMAIYRKVEQEICCYVPGEVSRIENILAREYKERHTRSLLSTEITDEETTETEIENQSDTVSTARNELQTEVANVLNKDNSIGVGASVGVTGKFPGGEASAETYFDFATSTSSSASDSEAKTIAQEITESALERILQKTTQKRISKVLEEYEENNRHGFDNREGTEHVTGVYRWVDIIYTNRLINYGKRLMIEFLIPEPSRFYKKALNQLGKQGSGGSAGNSSGLTPPLDPAAEGITGPNSIDEGNYLSHARTFGVTLPDPVLPLEDELVKTFGPADDPNGISNPNAKKADYDFSMNFLEFGDYTKYTATHVEASYNFDYHLKTGVGATETGTYFIIKVHSKTKSYDRDNLPDSEGTSQTKSRKKSDSFDKTLPNLKNTLDVTVDMKNVYDFSITLKVTMKVDEQEITNWQNECYDIILRAYQDDLDAYNAELAAVEAANEAEAEAAQEEAAAASHPNQNRLIEQRELQRIAIEMLTKPFQIKQGANFYRQGKCKVPQVKRTVDWDVYASHIKFFEQALDWNLMSYLFYPYYWADKCQWVDLLGQTDPNDLIFEGFLQSGMARMLVPVRLGFEEAVDLYLESGQIWNGGGLVMETDDDLYLSIDEELQEVEGVVEEEWETRVPTSLTILQGRSVYLDDEGLPCCHEVMDEDVDTKLRPSEAILGLPVAAEETEEEATD